MSWQMRRRPTTALSERDERIAPGDRRPSVLRVLCVIEARPTSPPSARRRLGSFPRYQTPVSLGQQCQNLILHIRARLLRIIINATAQQRSHVCAESGFVFHSSCTGVRRTRPAELGYPLRACSAERP